MSSARMPFLIADLVRLKYLLSKIHLIKKMDKKLKVCNLELVLSRRGYLTEMQTAFVRIVYNRTRRAVKQNEREKILLGSERA